MNHPVLSVTRGVVYYTSTQNNKNNEYSTKKVEQPSAIKINYRPFSKDAQIFRYSVNVTFYIL